MWGLDCVLCGIWRNLCLQRSFWVDSWSLHSVEWLCFGCNANSEKVIHMYEPLLHRIARRGHTHLVKALLALGYPSDTLDAHNRTALHCAAMAGHKNTVSVMLHPSIINMEDKDGVDVLSLAASHRWDDVVQRIVAKGADPQKTLDRAAGDGRADVVEFLLEKAVQPTDAAGALHRAASAGHAQIVGLLLKKGVPVDGRHDGMTALHIAAKEGRASVVKMLLEAGADAYARREITNYDYGDEDPEFVKHLYTPYELSSGDARELLEPFNLHAMIRCGNIDRIRQLLEAHPNLLEKQDFEGRGSFHLCTPLHYAATVGCNSVVEFLLDKGACINGHSTGKRRSGMPQKHRPLQAAAAQGHKDVVLTLLERGADVDACGDRPSPLQWAAENGHAEVVELLANHGAELNPEGESPLNSAVRNNRLDIVRTLVSSGANVNSEGVLGLVPLKLAKINENWAIARFLRRNGAKLPEEEELPSLHVAASEGDAEQVRSFLLNQPVDLRAPGGQTALHAAARYGHDDIVRMLIEKRADVDAQDEEGRAPLHLAVKHNRHDTVELLIKERVNVNARNKQGCSPLHLARRANTAELLIEAGAEVNARDNRKRTPLHHALVPPVGGGWDSRLIGVLIEAGADINAETSADAPNNVLSLAMEFRHIGVIGLLYTRGVHEYIPRKCRCGRVFNLVLLADKASGTCSYCGYGRSVKIRWDENRHPSFL